MSNLDLKILKTIIENKKCALDFISSCDTKMIDSDLYLFTTKLINYVKTYKDTPTKISFLDSLNKKESDQLYITMATIWEQVNEAQSNVKEYPLDIEKLKKRFSETLLTSLVPKIDVSNPEQSLKEIQNTLNSIKGANKKSVFSKSTLKDSVVEIKDRYLAVKNNPSLGKGIMTGYSFIDYCTNGYKNQSMILIGGETSAGKSMLLMNKAIQMWMQGNTIYSETLVPGYNVTYFSLEMPKEECQNRIICKLADLNYRSLENATLDASEMLRFQAALKFMRRYENQFEIIDLPRGCNASVIDGILEDTKSLFTPNVAVVDYLGLMVDDGDGEDWLKLGRTSGDLHEISRVHDLIMMSAFQLNAANPNKKSAEDNIGHHRVGRSKLITHHANTVMQIETRPNEKNYPTMNVHIIKNRGGMLGSGTLVKNFANSTIKDDFFDPNASSSDDISSQLDEEFKESTL